MAKAIATVGGTALVPGVSRNRRLYSREVIAGAVARAQERIEGDGLPLTMLTHHGAEDSSDRIVGRVTSMTVGEDGSARFTADIADTQHGRTIASLIDNSDGKPAFLSGVSIRGAWTGRVRKEAGPDGSPVETGPGLDLMGLDYTASPGVAGAAVDTFAWAADGQNETSERVLITESVEATVTVTEETTPTEDAPAGTGTGVGRVPAGVRETLTAFLGDEPHVLEDGLCVTCGGVEEAKRTRNAQPYGDVTYADPGYQKDKIKRYPLDTRSHIRAAWSYVNVAKNAAKYTSDQLKRIKGRIKAAMGRIGAKVSTETAGFAFSEPVQVTESVLEWMGEDPKRSGSWSINASNGPVSLNISSWCMDPAELDVILRAAADAACKALATLDPDMDGDIDVPGASDADTDHDAGKGHESAPPASTNETAPQPGPANTGHVTEREPAVSEDTSTTQAAGTAESAPAGITEADLAKAVQEAAAAAVTEALAARDEQARADRKAAKKAAKAAAREAAQGGTVTESTGGSGSTSPDAVKTAVAEALAAAGIKPAVEETEEQRVQRLVGEGVKSFIQEATASGAIIPGRTGVVVREHRTDPDTAPSADDLAKMAEDDFQTFAGKNLDAYTGDNTRIQSLTQ